MNNVGFKLSISAFVALAAISMLSSGCGSKLAATPANRARIQQQLTSYQNNPTIPPAQKAKIVARLTAALKNMPPSK